MSEESEKMGAKELEEKTANHLATVTPSVAISIELKFRRLASWAAWTCLDRESHVINDAQTVHE